MSNATSTSTRRSGPRNPWAPKIGMFALGAVLLGGLCVYSTVYFGFVNGEEFAPDTFNRRNFYFYEIPLVGIQISPISRSDNTGEIEDYLIKQKIIAPPKTAADPTARWDLVVARRGEILDSYGEAQILCHYLDAEDSAGKKPWLVWTEEHQDLAKVLWPTVLTVAGQELYALVPELLAIAKAATDPKDLKRELNVHLADEYLYFAEVQQDLNRHEAAIELYTAALDLAPGQIESYEGRASSLAALGKTDRADADLAQAKELKLR